MNSRDKILSNAKLTVFINKIPVRALLRRQRGRTLQIATKGQDEKDKIWFRVNTWG